MIAKRGKRCVLTCDKCHNTFSFSSWEEAFEYAMSHGWESEGLQHVCIDCQTLGATVDATT